MLTEMVLVVKSGRTLSQLVVHINCLAKLEQSFFCKNGSVPHLHKSLTIQARIAQLVAYWLGTGHVLGSNPSKGKNFSMQKNMRVCGPVGCLGNLDRKSLVQVPISADAGRHMTTQRLPRFPEPNTHLTQTFCIFAPGIAGLEYKLAPLWT